MTDHFAAAICASMKEEPMDDGHDDGSLAPSHVPSNFIAMANTISPPSVESTSGCPWSQTGDDALVVTPPGPHLDWWLVKERFLDADPDLPFLGGLPGNGSAVTRETGRDLPALAPIIFSNRYPVHTQALSLTTRWACILYVL